MGSADHAHSMSHMEPTQPNRKITQTDQKINGPFFKFVANG